MTEHSNCPFCGNQQRTLKDNDLARVILSNPHKVPGHFLIIPKRHVEKPWELTPDELAAIFELVFFVEQRLLTAKLGTGVDIRQNYRPFVPDNKLKVSHVHFHVYPRSHEDYLYQIAEQYETDLFAELDDAEAAAVAKILK